MQIANQAIESTTTVAELERVLALQKAAYLANPYPSEAQRQDALDRLLNLLRLNTEAIEEAISEDFGSRSRDETYAFEVLSSTEEIRHTKRSLRKWMKREKRPVSWTSWPARAEIIRQPLGVIGIIVPWNYPLYLAVSPIVGALSAGNRVMVKMSEFTPRFSQLFAELVASSFAEDELFIVTGEADVARAFSSQTFDHILFTGSTATGRHVSLAAAANLTPVTLELGGKSPTIICDDADMDSAVSSILFGKLANVGQTCIAPDYVLLPRGSETAFIDAARRAVQRFYPTLESNQDYSCIVNERQAQRLRSYIADAEAKGATLHALHEERIPDGSRKFVPLLFTNVSDDMLIMQDEIFGPLLPLRTYEHFDEAIAYVNARPRPLALYLFTKDKQRTEHVLHHTISGGVVTNSVMLHVIQNDLPFGGVGPSGSGHYHGKDGFDTFSKLKGVMHQSAINGASLMHPPRNNGRLRWVAKLLIR